MKTKLTLFLSQISSVCRAAVHAGVVRNQGGYVDVMPVDKRKVYIASFQNGIFSERYRAHFRRLLFTLHLNKVYKVLYYVSLYLGQCQKPNKQANLGYLQSLCNSCSDFGEAVVQEPLASSKLVNLYSKKLLIKNKQNKKKILVFIILLMLQLTQYLIRKSLLVSLAKHQRMFTLTSVIYSV